MVNIYIEVPRIYSGDPGGVPSNDTARGGYDETYGKYGDDDLVSDRFCGRENHVYLDGGPGNDFLHADSEFYGTWGKLVGGEGNDEILGGGSYVDTLEGGAGDDFIRGEGAYDLIDGGEGRDRLDGGSFSDTILGGDGDDSGSPIQTGPYGSVVAPGLFGDRGDDSLDGGGGNDRLEGGDDNDTLIGGTGSDTMEGGLDDDTYGVDDKLDEVREHAGEGIDTVEASIDYTLTENVENLVLTGAAASGTGNIWTTASSAMRSGTS
jgi:Ca2+-binding RTX toxin-like protein